MIDYHINNLQKGVLQNIQRKTGTVKVMTREQQEVIEKLAYWLNGGFKKDCGILLLGSIGTGKTTIMEVLVAYYHFLHGRIVRKYHAKELPMQINKLGIDYFYKRPVFIDDLGKESATTVIWGQRYDTWSDIFSLRYENKALTFATANYTLEAGFKEKYGDVIVDRMKEHFNIIELKGESLRV